MKRWKKILLLILLLLVLAAAGLVWWQWENIQAVKEGLQHSTEEIEDKLQANDQTIKDAVAAAPEVVIRDVTDEERQALKDGTLTPEELAGKLLETEPPVELPVQQSTDQQSTQQPEQKPAQQPEENPEEKPAVDPEYQKQVSAIIAEVYVLREQFTLELDNMMETARAEYNAMSEQERTADQLVKWARGYISRASKLERDCDARMYDIIVRLDKLVTEHNGDPKLVDTVFDTYTSEKSLKKAWYMSKLEKRGLV